ncbi:MAG: GerMN domain-containing protein [Vulcanibacillus sp.]
MLRGNLFKLFLILFIGIFGITGCGLYGPKDTTGEIDPPPVTLTLDEELSVSEIPNSEQISLNNTDEVVTEQEAKKIKSTIYFLDQNNDVVPLTFDLPKVEGIAQQVLEYMTIGGPAEELLPEGFKPVIPKDTSFTVNIKSDQHLAIIDFSKDFFNYEAESSAQEKKILDAITWSMTEFSTIDKVQIRVNGYELTEMPVWGTPIIDDLSRIDGINLELANNINVSDTTAVTLYFYRVHQDQEYLVPVTRLIPKTDNLAKATLEQLIIGPKTGSDFVSTFLPTTKILNVKLSNGLLIADFDEDVMGFENQLTSELIDMIVFSITETTNVSKIQIKVMGQIKPLPENYSLPIMRSEVINATLF